MTSEELAACSSDSCPSTPDRQAGSPNPGEWEPPAQLGAEAFALLNSLAPEAAGSGSESGDIDMPDDAVHEMRQIVRDPPVRHQLIPGSDLSVPNFTPGSEPVSALTVPSPGGFFASLHASARQTWCVSTSPPPSTGTAEQFYGVPWRSNSPPRNPGLRLDTQRAVTPPPFLRKDSLFSPTDGLGIEATEITESAFRAASQGGSEPQSERTKNWLFAQWTYLSTITTESPKVETPKTPENKIKSCFSPDTPSTGRTNPFEDSPSKKSVRFLESVPESEEATFTHRSAEVEPLFFQGFKYISSRFRGMDAFLHSQTRAEASHVSSSSLSQQHMSQLSGSFTLQSPDRPHPARPISALVPTATDEDEHSKTITLAERERQALEQIMPSVWSLHAARHVFGSTLIASPAIAHLRSSPNRRILDFGGAPSCDWGWAVALQFRHCAVVTVPFDPIPTLSAPLTGPPNHSIIHAPNLTTLPFPSASFDLISARSIHVLLRTIRPDPATHPTRDEYDALLSEFLRVLKPGGYLEFNLLDAELLHPGPLGQALSVEFAFVLRQRGYDPQASRYFLPRLRKAGFEDVKRAWLVLPAADVVPRWVDKGKMMAGHGRGDSGVGLKGEAEEREGERFFEVERGRSAGGGKEVFEPPVVGRTRDVRGMTGLVGARAWEKWVLKVQREAGGNEEKMLERVNRALEEAGRVKAGWRCLMGWARKAE
ncbi:hypothetical protein B9Z65_4625 [Elsinoe australis]|uniref:Methyltransferase type 11 domain-containing protein n=1 Tax=Elsinoe australis TaxID=40998 RepID=A0A2P8A5K7_9PEZI|nr:hypothetical protein B9Z65_4625 [Elsinoe australis]